MQHTNGLMSLCLNGMKFEYVIDSGLYVLSVCVTLMRAGEGNTSIHIVFRQNGVLFSHTTDRWL
jgi:hypothetical protein